MQFEYATTCTWMPSPTDGKLIVEQLAKPDDRHWRLRESHVAVFMDTVTKSKSDYSETSTSNPANMLVAVWELAKQEE